MQLCNWDILWSRTRRKKVLKEYIFDGVIVQLFNIVLLVGSYENRVCITNGSWLLLKLDLVIVLYFIYINA